jgi:hypothetical protein
VDLGSLASLLVLGYPDQALSCCRRALVEAQDVGHPESLAHAMSSAAGLAQDLCHVEAAREWAEAVIALATEQGLPHSWPRGRCSGPGRWGSEGSFRILLWTGLRRSDAVRLGRQHVTPGGDAFVLTTVKSGHPF